jgi:anaerobic ribonucleoside-triphosphate reductase
LSKNYWLTKIYPQEIKRATLDGDLHIHDLNLLATYCVGWDLQDLLMEGFKGVEGKLESKPAKHFRTALGQLVNFFYTMQGESAGAQAVSNFDTLLAPFIRFDGLKREQIKQALQEFMFNMNVPTRVGFQCNDEQTEILTEDGWKKHNEVDLNKKIATYNLQNRNIEYLPIEHFFSKHYEGEMYHITSQKVDQLVSPEHRVVYRDSVGNDKKELAENLLDRKILQIPIKTNGNLSGNTEDENIVKLIAYVISEGSVDKNGRGVGRISIYQSKDKHSEVFRDIQKTLENLGLEYTLLHQTGWGECDVFRLDSESSQFVYDLFDSDKQKGIKFVPKRIMSLSKDQSDLFIQTYLKGDGSLDSLKTSTVSEKIRDGLMVVAVNAGYAVSSKTIPVSKLSKNNKRDLIKIKFSLSETSFTKIKKVSYSGVIWCPNTKNETVIARRNGKVFITGNTPFTNVTLDLKVPRNLIDQPVIIGGKPQKETYKDFQKEMDLFNDVFAEVISEGDAKGRVFTFPIPTYNITKDFDWDNPRLKNLWKMTAKYGIPSFSNFINSDMDPEDARSMCPLGGNEEILIKSSRGFGLEKISLKAAHYNSREKKEAYYTVFTPNGFKKCTVNQYVDKELVEIELANGHKIKTTTDHTNLVTERIFDEILKEVSSNDLKVGMYLPYSLKPIDSDIGIYDIGYIIGCYAGDGSLDGDTSVVFSLSVGKKEKTLEKIIKIVNKYFGGRYKVLQDKKLLTLTVKSKSLNGLCRDFVVGKQRDKKYHANIYSTSLDFRRGVKDGHYDTDGGNRNRIYTSSYEMVKSLNLLAATMGTTTNVTIDKRIKEAGSLSDNPIYTVRFYNFKSNNYGDVWYKNKDYVLVKIKDIKKVAGNMGYCLEVAEGDPIFTVANTGIVTHNCRLRLDTKKLQKRGGGLFGANPLTGSIGVVTINLPRLGFKSKDKREFLYNLNYIMDLARDSLEIKRKILEQTTEAGLYPYSKFYLRNIKKRDSKYWSNHFSTIGLLGMNEALLNLIGKDISSKEGLKLSLEIMDFMRDKISKYQEETGNYYNLEATPAEGTSHRLAKIDREKYPEIIVANESDPVYYTNSTQLPVDFSDDVFEVLDLQDDLQSKYTGGTVIHLFIGEEISDTEAMKNLIKSICNNYKLPYFTISPTFSICPTHGYLPGKVEKCECGLECEIYARIVGYIRPIKQWNPGKRAEFDDRVTFKT